MTSQQYRRLERILDLWAPLVTFGAFCALLYVLWLLRGLWSG